MADLVGAMGCGDEKEKRFVGKLASTFARGRAEACSGRNAGRLFLTDSTSICKVWSLRIATSGAGRRQGSGGSRTVHELRPRKDQPWVAANSDVLNDELIASGLVGDARRVFTGATATRSSTGLPRNLQGPELDAVEGCSLLTLKELKRRCIAKVLEGAGYNKGLTAEVHDIL